MYNLKITKNYIFQCETKIKKKINIQNKLLLNNNDIKNNPKFYVYTFMTKEYNS